MKKFFKKIKKLEHEHLLEIAGLSAAAMLLVFAAVFIGSGGMAKVNRLLAANHVVPGSQTASVFPENNTSYSLVGLYNLQNNVYPGTPVTWVWNGGTYGANTFSAACGGSTSGPNYICRVTLGSPDSSAGTCTAPTKLFSNWTGDCGNADSSSGYHGYGPNGGQTEVGWGYWGGAITLTAPSAPGPYIYYMCSQYISHTYGSAYSCASNSLTVISDNCPATPTAVSGGLQVPPGTYHIVAQANDFCVTNNSGQYLFVPANSATEVSYFRSATQGYLAGTVAYFARATGY